CKIWPLPCGRFRTTVEAMLRRALVLCLCGACGSSNPPNTGRPPEKMKPDNTVGGFVLDVPKVTLLPGDEKLLCFVQPLVLMGPSHVVGGGQLMTTPGLHHGNITTRPITGTGTCDNNGSEIQDVIAGGTVLFGSSTQITGSEWLSFPRGMGFKI